VNISKIVDVFRIREFIGRLQTNAIVALMYLLILGISAEFILAYFIFIFYQSILVLYGYLLNSWCDSETDSVVRKNPVFHEFPKKSIAVTLWFFGIIAFAIPFFFNNNVIVAGIAGFFFATAYSLKPIRLKERGFLGLIAAALPQSILPFIFFVFLTAVNEIAVFLSIWLLLKQLLEELLHQKYDFEFDKKSKTKSFAISVGYRNLNSLINLFFALFLMWAVVPIFVFGGEGLFLSFMLAFFSVHLIAKIFSI
jgi:4-hydroxybenzoate polyprenyltransferase